MRRRHGFTLVELTVALGIAVVISGLVLVRVEGWSSRQTLRSEALALGNLVRTYREKAQFEERLYLLTLEPETGRYRIEIPLEESAGTQRERVRSGKLDRGIRFEKLEVAGQEAKGVTTLSLGPRGIVPETRITLKNLQGEGLVLVIGSLTHEIVYSETR